MIIATGAAGRFPRKDPYTRLVDAALSEMRIVRLDALTVLKHARTCSCRMAARRQARAAVLTMDVFASEANHEDYVPGERP